MKDSPVFSLRTKPSTKQGMILYEWAAVTYAEPIRSEVMSTVHLIEKEVAQRMSDHAFPNCEVCGAFIDDPEALESCVPEGFR